MQPNASGGLGYLGRYGILVVPAPSDGEGAWFLALAHWDADRETYVASPDGPMFDTQDEAIQEANRLTAWLAEHQDDDQLERGWQAVHQTMSEGFTPWTGTTWRSRDP